MARDLADMSIEQLLDLRDEITAILSEKAVELKRQIARLAAGEEDRAGRRSLKGRKVPAKYRGPGGETWTGRGSIPRWMRDVIESGANPDDYLIADVAAGSPKRPVGRPRKRGG